MAVAVRPSASIQSPSPHQAGLLPVDVILLGYLGIVTVVAVHRAPSQPGCWWLVVANGFVGLLIALLSRPGLGRLGSVLREIYPLLLLVGLYGQLDVLNRGVVRAHDALVQQWELGLFGIQVSRVWWQAAGAAM